MKRAFALVLCLAVLLALALPAGAEQQTKFLHPFTQVEDSTLSLAGAPAGEGTVSVTVNGQSFDHYSITTVQEAKLPVTYYCVVDQSSSFSNSQKQQQERGLTALSDALRSMDSMVLVLMGEDVSFGEPLTTPEARQQGIEEACVYSARFTDLNASIVTVVETVAQAQDGNSLSCIVLFTDGLDNAHTPVSREQVTQAIAESALNFSVLSLVDPWADQFAQNNATQAGEFAAASLGGVSKIPARDDFDSPTGVEDDIAEIMAQVLSGTVITLDATALPRTENTLNIGITWAQDGNKVTDSRSVDTALLPSLPEPTQPETTEATQPETTEATQPETTLPETIEAAQPETTLPETIEAAQPETTLPETIEAARPVDIETTSPVETRAPSSAGSSSGNLILTFVLAGLAVVVVLVALAVLLWRKQRDLEKADEEEADQLTPPEAPPAEDKPELPSLAELKRRLHFEREPQSEDPMPDLDLNIPIRQPDNIPGCRVRLVPQDHPAGVVEFTIGVNESVTLGRNQRADIVLSETDRALSSLHFELQWDSRVLHLRDRKSTNGTALNGVPLRPEVWARVENKAAIQAGATRYTVFVEKK